MTPILGFDIRIDEKGRLQPWRVVLTTLERRHQHRETLMALPSSQRYLTPPNHLVHGDLTEIGTNAHDALASVSAQIHAMGRTTVHVDSTHVTGVAASLLAWNGINLAPVDVDMPHDATLDDPYAIGGEAGHEIANIIKHLEAKR